MLVSTAAYFALYFVLHPLIGNDALWLAFTTYMLARGVVQYFISDRLRGVYAKAD
jgi:MATE family multidrug resistance protein